MKRKATIALAVTALLCLAWFTGRVPYHKWRWRVSIQTSERLRAGQYTRSDAIVDLLRSDPKTYQDYEAAAAKHEAALIRLGYLARQEFRLTESIRTDAAIIRFLMLASQRFPNRAEWSVLFPTSGDTVTVTTIKERMPDWEKFILEFNTTKKASRSSKCKPRSRPLNPVQVRWF